MPRASLRAWLNEPRDPAGLAAFRALFGALMVGAVVRFWALGWIESLYLAPDFHFTWAGFDWVRPWPGIGLYLHFAAMGLAAFGLCVGWRTRLSAAVFCATFTYAELLDKTTYLNHYYLVSLLALLLVFVPAGAAMSLDARRTGPRAVPRWAYLLLRVQVGLVYFHAGLAKLDTDWLLRAEPLGTWLATFADRPLVGPLLAAPATAFLMSWAGALFDLTLPLWLSVRRTRRVAYAVACLFHTTVWLLFPIGVFSWVMLVSATVFFEPGWPRRLRRRAAQDPPLAPPVSPLGRPALTALALYVLLQAVLPLRHLLYPGPVNWTEEGFRFAWRVMLVEKSGQVEYEVRTARPEGRFVVYPRAELTPMQHKMLTTQPDLIHDYAAHLAARYRDQGFEGVQVFARAWASLNGRPAAPLVDPAVDLAALPRSIRPQAWILPPPDASEHPTDRR